MMIVKITNESKKWMTVYELEQAKIIIQQFNEDDSMADLCQIAARIASKSVYDCFEILRSSAKIARNCRIQNMYHENSGDLVTLERTILIWFSMTAQKKRLKESATICILGNSKKDRKICRVDPGFPGFNAPPPVTSPGNA